MILMVGLGNPGKKHKDTRHNVGFFVIEELRKKSRAPDFKHEKKFEAEVTRLPNLILAKPQTFMNNSGKTVKKLVTSYKLRVSNLWVIHDDIDIKLGEFKIQKARGSAGHKGVQSIIAILKTKAFNRVRVGIKSQDLFWQNQTKIPTEKFVLQKFSPEEKKIIKKTTKEIIEKFQEILRIS